MVSRKLFGISVMRLSPRHPGREALALAAKAKPDAVLLDLRMQG